MTMTKQRYDVIEIDGEGQEFVARQVVRDTPPSARNCKTLANGRLALRERVEQRAAFDPQTEALEAQPPVVEKTHVVYPWAARALTAEELAERSAPSEAEVVNTLTQAVLDLEAGKPLDNKAKELLQRRRANPRASGGTPNPI